jgi:hypothetical protein
MFNTAVSGRQYQSNTRLSCGGRRLEKQQHKAALRPNKTKRKYCFLEHCRKPQYTRSVFNTIDTSVKNFTYVYTLLLEQKLPVRDNII